MTDRDPPPPPEQPASASWRDTHHAQIDGLRELLDVVRVSDVMSAPVRCPLFAGLDMIQGLLLKTDAHGAVVVDDAGRLQGIITKTDLVRREFSAADAGDEVEVEDPVLDGRSDTASELMTPMASSAHSAHTLREVLRIIEREQVFSLPVVASAEDPTVVGMISCREVVDWLGRLAGAGRRIRGTG